MGFLLRLRDVLLIGGGQYSEPYEDNGTEGGSGEDNIHPSVTVFMSRAAH